MYIINMQITISIVLLTVVFATVQAGLIQQQRERIYRAVEICKPKTGASDDDIKALLALKIPEDKPGQCFFACMNKEFGMMTAANTMNLEKIKFLAAFLKEVDTEKYEKGMKVIETCNAEVMGEADECVAAKKIMECSKREAEVNGLDLKDIMKQ